MTALENTNRELSQTVNQLRGDFRKLQRIFAEFEDQLSKADSDIRIQLSAQAEQIQLLQFRADPYANNGEALADTEDF